MTTAETTTFSAFLDVSEMRTARVGVGLGYLGLPLVLLFEEAVKLAIDAGNMIPRSGVNVART